MGVGGRPYVVDTIGELARHGARRCGGWVAGGVWIAALMKSTT